MKTLRLIGGFEILTAVIMKSTAFRAVTPCTSEGALRFGGTYRLFLQGRRVSQARKKQKQAATWVCRPVLLAVLSLSVNLLPVIG
jgi:hypothetical protein